MEKPKPIAGTNEELLNKVHIPDDLTFSILSKLPLKSLKRFTCVTKSWSLLFQNPHFINMLRNHFLSINNSDSGDTFIFRQEGIPPAIDEYPYHGTFYLLSGADNKFENSVKLDLPPPFHDDDTNIYILGSVSINGILCLGQERTRGIVETFRAVLWNPPTTEFVIIPPSLDESVPPYRRPYFNFHGFGYDHVRDDYKVVRHITFFPRTDEEEDVPWEDRSYAPLLEIYSLRSNSWRILEFDMHEFHYPLTFGVYMDGVCHWWGKSEAQNVGECLVSFALSNEVLFTTPYPSYMDENCDFGLMERHLVLLNESIALISNCFEANTFQISILGELGVMKSWIKLFIVGPMPFVECPIGVGKKGNICFKKKNDELVWVDLSTQIIDEIGVKACRDGCQMGIYKEVLLPIRGINN